MISRRGFAALGAGMAAASVSFPAARAAGISGCLELWCPQHGELGIYSMQDSSDTSTARAAAWTHLTTYHAAAVAAKSAATYVLLRQVYQMTAASV